MKSLSLLLSLASLNLTGCANTDYSCRGMPDNPSCLSTVAAYELSNQPLETMNPQPPAPVDHEDDKPLALPTPAAPPAIQQPVPHIEDPLPLRTPSRVMRIWIAPWEDSDGDLIVSGFVFTEIESRRWSIAKSGDTPAPRLIPLQVEHRKDGVALTGESDDTGTLQDTLPKATRH